MHGQPSLRNVEELILIENKYGETIENHIDEISNAAYVITGIEKTGPYLKMEELINKFEMLKRTELEVLINQLNFPLAIHACEAFRKRIDGTWKIVSVDQYWMIYVQKGDLIYHPQKIYESYTQDFKIPVEAEIYGESTNEDPTFNVKEVIQKLQQTLDFKESELDFSVKSLKLFDEKIMTHRDLFMTPDIYLQTQLYLGEVFIKEHGGDWFKKSNNGQYFYGVKTLSKHIFPITTIVYETFHEDDHGLELSGFYYYYLNNLQQEMRR